MDNLNQIENLLRQFKELSDAYDRAYARIPPDDTMHTILCHIAPAKALLNGQKCQQPLCRQCHSDVIEDAERLAVAREKVKSELKSLNVRLD